MSCSGLCTKCHNIQTMFEYGSGQKTDSDEDVIFVSEKPIPKPPEIKFDQEKLLALQREIDQQSQPRQQHSPLTSSTVAIKRPIEMKMEKNNEGSSIKKKQRLKKQQTSQPESFDPGVQKEKKSQTVNMVAKEECEKCWGKSVEPEEKKKNKNFDSFPTNEENKSLSKKEKKKQMMDEVVNKVENVQKCVIKDQSKKKKKKSLTLKSDNTAEEDEQHIGEQKIQKKDGKLKTNVHHGSIEQTEDVGRKKKRSKKEASLTIDDVTKNKRKAKGEEKEIKLETPEVEVEEVKLKKKKKKEVKTKESGGLEVAETNKKKNKRVEDKIHYKKKDNYTEEIITEEEKAEVKTKSKKNRCKTASVEDVQQEEMEPKKKKARLEWDAGKDVQSSRKNKKSRTTSVEDTGEEETEPKKKKKKARFKEWGVGEDTQSSANKITKAADTKNKNSKKTKVKVEPELNTEVGVKKKRKMKKEQKDSQEVSLVDVVFMSEKNGNTDEVTINQERRKALQMEVDEASQPQKTTKAVGLGQWSTAQFDSSQKQQKFLRLMGGFKKGFQPAVATPGGSNMALGKDAQLQQGLLGEFERAHSRRMDFGSRGAGLGFTASLNKKYSIDINASRSIRFED